MSRLDRDGMSKREYFREKRRRAEQMNRLIWIGAVVLIALVIAFFFVYPLYRKAVVMANATLTPVQPVVTAQARTRPNVNRNSTGDPNAPVKLTEYSDFQCPFCRQFWTETEAQVIDAYVTTGKVYFTYRSAGNWVSNNANAQTGQDDHESENAAAAAYCAADQGKFWEMHDALFSNALGEADGTSFPDRRLPVIAGTVGLDVNAFSSCYSSGKYKDQVSQDFQDAQTAGIQGTPFFVITYTVNGVTQTATIDGAQAFDVFQKEFDKDLAAAGAH